MLGNQVNCIKKNQEKTKIIEEIEEKRISLYIFHQQVNLALSVV